MEKDTVKELHPPKDMAPCKRLYNIFKGLFLERSVQDGLVRLANLSLAGDGTPYAAAKERKKRTCSCLEKGIRDCSCDRIYRQPDCNIGWDSHQECWYFCYDLYVLTAADSENDLPIFPFLESASRHNSIDFLYNWFSVKQFLPEAKVTKHLLDSAHDAMPYYEYCRKHKIIPFIDLKWCSEPLFLTLSFMQEVPLIILIFLTITTEKGHSPYLGKCPFNSIQLLSFERFKFLKHTV